MSRPDLQTLAVVLVIVLTTFLGGCSWEEARFKETRTLTVPWRQVQAVAVRTENGGVEVLQAGGTETVITAELRATTEDRLKQSRVMAEPAGDGTLEVSVFWPEGGRKGSEGCSFSIRTPGANGVSIETGNGRVKTRGLAGEARLRTSNGAVEVTDHDGSVDADTSNGSVTIERARGPVRVDTSNGAVRVILGDDHPGPVEIRTSNGSVVLDVGPAFRGTLDLDTSNGAVILEVPDSVGVKLARKTSASLDFGPGGGASKVTSSNGSITVQLAGMDRRVRKAS